MIKVNYYQVNYASRSEVDSVVAMNEMVGLFEQVHASGRSNFEGCRIALPNSKLNMAVWPIYSKIWFAGVVMAYLKNAMM